MLKQHNKLRARHNAKALVLDKKLNALAQKWAEHLLKNDMFDHSPKGNRPGIGENLASCSAYPETHFNKKCPTTDASQEWYDEVEIYKNQPGSLKKPCSGDCSKCCVGHFTQLVWKESKRVGFGVAIGKVGKWYKKITVANYSPSGNSVLIGHERESICNNVEFAHGAGNRC